LSGLVRRKSVVASAVLIAVVAMAAAPGFVGSRAPGPIRPVDAAAFKPVQLAIPRASALPPVAPLDAAHDSASVMDTDELFAITGARAPRRPTTRARVAQPQPKPRSAIKPGKYQIRGYATWYDNGTTAMRLPRGTKIRVCGPAACVQRVVSDFGPTAGHKPDRVVDLTPADFRHVCGCSLGAGTVKVTVSVY
jgi:hypothetical protein